MRGRTQFWLGSVMLAVAIGILVGGLVAPRPAVGQGAGEIVKRSYGLATGIPGTTSRTFTETVYVLDDVNDVLYVLEYNSKRRRFEPCRGVDIRRYATEIIRQRAKRTD